jgi:SagB-type dehydrogenase family enzyme
MEANVRIVSHSALQGPTSDQHRSPDEDYHIAIRNHASTKRFYKVHEVNYSERVQTLVTEAPLRLDGPVVPLPPADMALLDLPLGDAIVRRRSERSYGARPLSSVELATLLTLANGVREAQRLSATTVAYRRYVTSSGNLGSVEIYPVVMRVEGLDPGIYHFDTVGHHLAQITPGYFASWLKEAVLFQLEFAGAALALVLTSAFGRLKAKYGPRGYKLGLLDVGHVSQNVYLIATALGLNVCSTAGYVDERLDAALGLDGLDTATSLVMAVGAKA